jgi:hypothetical protein
MEECRCCTEMEECMQKVSSYSQDNSEQVNCVIEHPGFDEVSLKQWVLEVAGISLKNRNGKRTQHFLIKEGQARMSFVELYHIGNSFVLFMVILDILNVILYRAVPIMQFERGLQQKQVVMIIMVMKLVMMIREHAWYTQLI